jgi:hypothetical protein
MLGIQVDKSLQTHFSKAMQIIWSTDTLKLCIFQFKFNIEPQCLRIFEIELHDLPCNHA